MEEKEILRFWNQKRAQIISTQMGPTIFLAVLVFVSMTHDVKGLSNNTKAFVVVITAIVGILAIINQIAIIREGHALVISMRKLPNLSPLGKSVADSERFIVWTGVLINFLGLVAWGMLLRLFYR